MKVIIVGASGKIGSRVAERLSGKPSCCGYLDDRALFPLAENVNSLIEFGKLYK